MNRRIVTLLAALAPVTVLGVLGSVLAVPYVALGPGPTFNTLGDADGKPVVDIRGAELDPTSGHLNMTTVSVRDGLSLFEAFGYWISGRSALVPRSEVYPPDKSREEIDQDNADEFTQSEDSAELAALRYLKYPLKVQIGAVADPGPSNGTLRSGDDLLSVDGTPVADPKAVQNAVSGRPPGTELPLVVRRDGADVPVTVRLGARPDDPAKGYLGITPTESGDVPFTVDFNLADIGGPSAGLMFSLAVVDKLSPGELSGGGFVAGTGTIDNAGVVGPIGGIRFKMIAAREAGATTFLVPADNCSEARQQPPAGLRLIKVEKLDDAVGSLEALTHGGDTPTCN
ncbi:PDZ domain-containing protein [Skermania piniformis]|uniref:endopeptidase La n=1 Tax=Skermania pinensis TaxID=39122 RepID=A0ABX8S524_9ACTN|nr:PDZ domain-containing protein [Skermania piniformis]QXQ12853.1 PDZ domain-containing protein [Skermania piniformis]